MIKKLFPVVIFLACTFIAGAQALTPVQYIEQYKDLAIREMKRMGVPASITLAQGLLETENGNSTLLKKSNNHFGIKCKNNWSGNGVSHDDDAIGECFRTYKSAEDSYRDHSNFLRGSERYAPLFDLDPADYKGWAQGLKKAGYATNPKYPAILIKHIEQYNLQQYSLMAAGEVPKYDKGQFEDDKEVPFIYTEESPANNTAPAIKAVYTNDNAKAGESLPDNIGVVNKVKCVYAARGTSLLAIAIRNDIQLARLLQFNDMTEDGILFKDQIIYLQKKSTRGQADFHITQKNETLQEVAQQQGIQLEYLAAYNQLTTGTVIKEGTKLWLQPAKNIAANTQVLKEEREVVSATKLHAVQAKEGLYGISKKYGVTVQQLKEWNNLTSDNLSIGQQLIVAK